MADLVWLGEKQKWRSDKKNGDHGSDDKSS